MVVQLVNVIHVYMVNLLKMFRVATKKILVYQQVVCAKFIHGMIELIVVQKNMMDVVHLCQQTRFPMIQTSCFHVFLNAKRMLTVSKVKNAVEHVHHDVCQLLFLKLILTLYFLNLFHI